jgi:hypothetical protein
MKLRLTSKDHVERVMRRSTRKKIIFQGTDIVYRNTFSSQSGWKELLVEAVQGRNGSESHVIEEQT